LHKSVERGILPSVDWILGFASHVPWPGIAAHVPIQGTAGIALATIMLVLSRKPGERILIGDKIAITVVRIAPGVVRIGVEAPDEFPILREELANGDRLPENGDVQLPHDAASHLK
jgi:carbon storage regulator